MDDHVCDRCVNGIQYWATAYDPELALAWHRFAWTVLEALHIQQSVKWLDRQLRRWPWLYKRLGG